MNLNELAQIVSLKEGKKKPTNIAQIKEVIHATCEVFASLSLIEFGKLVFKMRKKGSPPPKP